MFGPTQPQESQPGGIVFHPRSPEEYGLSKAQTHLATQLGFCPKYRDYVCATCGSKTTGRVLCDLIRESDSAIVSWCICSCDERAPTLIIERDGEVIAQYPTSKEFHVGPNWPTDLANLYEEASKTFAASAHTACAMVCRKVLMATACENGDDDGKTFVQYVDYIIDKVLTFPKARDAIKKIKDIGNEANHKIAFVAEPDARRSMQIVTYMLNTIYSLPSS